MTRVRWLCMFVSTIFAFGLMAQPASATTTQIVETSMGGTALFSSTNGCIETDVQVDAGRFTISGVLVPGGSPQLSMIVDIKQLNTCTHTTVQDLSATSTAHIDVFTVSNSALHVEGFDYIFDSTLTTPLAIVNVNVTWMATGGDRTTTFHSEQAPGLVGAHVVNSSKTVRTATASGTVTIGSTTFASGTAVSAELSRYSARWIKP